MFSPMTESDPATTFVSFQDNQRARRRPQSAGLSTPSRRSDTVASARYATPGEPMLSAIASVRYGGTPSWYEDALETGDWVGGGAGASATRAAMAEASPTMAIAPLASRTRLVSRPPMPRTISPSSGADSPHAARSTTRSPPRPMESSAPSPSLVRAPATTTNTATAPQPLPVRHTARTSGSVRHVDASARAALSRTRDRPQPHASASSTRKRSSTSTTAHASRRGPETSSRHRAPDGPLTAEDRRLAGRDHRLRHGARPEDSVVASPSPALQISTGPALAVPAAATASSSSSSSSLTVALSAHWQSVQSFLDATAPLDGRAPVLVGAEAAQVRDRIEADLLATMALLPERARGAVADASGVVPLLLAFGIAPVPTARTQAIALGALRALLVSLPSVVGGSAATAFVDTVLLGQHHGLEALELALVAAMQLSERAHTAPVEASHTAAHSPSSSPSSAAGTRLAELSTANRLMVNVLSLLHAVTALSRGFALACLGTAKSELVQRVVQYLPAALSHGHGGPSSSSPSVPTASDTVTQETAMGGFLLALCEQEPAATDVLVAYGAHRVLLDHLRVLLRHAAQPDAAEAEQIAPPPLILSLRLYLRLVTRLVRGCPHAFRPLYQGTTLLTVVTGGLASAWGPVVEVSGVLLVALLEGNPEPELGGLLARQVLATRATVALLTGLLVSQQSTHYAVTAALVWRWLALVQPVDCAVQLSEDTGLLTAFLQVLLYHTMPSAEVETTTTTTTTTPTVPLLLVESTLALCIAVALGSLEARRRLQGTLHAQLSEVTRTTLRQQLEHCVCAMADDYLDMLPAVEVRATASRTAVVAPAPARHSHAALVPPSSTRSSTQTTTSATRVLYQTAEFASRSSRATSTDNEDESGDEAEPTTRSDPAMGTAQSTSPGTVRVDAAAQWRRLLRRAVRDMLPDTRRSSGSATASDHSTLADASLALRRPHGPVVVLAPTLLSAPARTAAPVETSVLSHGTLANESVAASFQAMSVADQSRSGGGGGAGVRARVLGLDTLRYRDHPICQRAEQVMGPRLLQASIEVVLQLAQSYADSSPVLPISAQGKASASARTITPHDRSAPVEKARNPWAPPAPARALQRVWSVDRLEQADVLLFVVRADHLVDDLTAAIAVVADHLRYLRRQLQICPQRAMVRRSLLTDLYRNVYPKVHLFLRYIDSQIGRSRAVLQLLSSLDGGFLHSGNLIEAYDSVGICVGDQPPHS